MNQNKTSSPPAYGGSASGGKVFVGDQTERHSEATLLPKNLITRSKMRSFALLRMTVDSRLRQKSQRIYPQGAILDGSDDALWRKKIAGMTSGSF